MLTYASMMIKHIRPKSMHMNGNGIESVYLVPIVTLFIYLFRVAAYGMEM